MAKTRNKHSNEDMAAAFQALRILKANRGMPVQFVVVHRTRRLVTIMGPGDADHGETELIDLEAGRVVPEDQYPAPSNNGSEVLITGADLLEADGGGPARELGLSIIQ